MKKIILLKILFLISICKVLAQTNSNTNQVENNLIPYVPVKGFKSWNIKERMKFHNIPGASIAVIKDYKIDFAKSYGFADTALKIKATNHTIYAAGSISKLVTSTIVLKLVDEGKLHLDSNVNKYLTSWKLDNNEFTKQTPITLRMLLSHTAGASQSSYWGFQPTKKNLPTVQQILNGGKDIGSNKVVINSEPNKQFRYSGGGYIIVQIILMDVLKKDFETIAKQYVFIPLKMNNSTFAQPLPNQFKKYFSNGYSTASWYTGIPYIYPQQAAAALHTTAKDLANFMIAIQKSIVGKSNFLSKKMANTLVAPQVKISDGSYLEQMGVGTFLLEQSNNTTIEGKYFEHQGANAGFVGFAIGSIVKGNGAIILLNSGDDFSGFGMELRRSIAKTYNWINFLPKEVEPIVLNANEIYKYEGRYRKGVDEVVTIRAENNYFVEQINGGKIIYCFPVHKDTIIFTDYNIKGIFEKDSLGNILSLRTNFEPKEKGWKKMANNEFTPTEYLTQKNYAAAKDGFRKMNMNEYQITYLAYNLMNQKPTDQKAVETILQLALEQHPNSSIVYARWGDYYLLKGDKEKAKASFSKAMELDPNDEESKQKLNTL